MSLYLAISLSLSFSVSLSLCLSQVKTNLRRRGVGDGEGKCIRQPRHNRAVDGHAVGPVGRRPVPQKKMKDKSRYTPILRLFLLCSGQQKQNP